MNKEAETKILQGQIAHLTRRMSDILQIVPDGASVAIEGTPIYLDRPWADEHSLGYNHLLSTGREFLLQRSCRVEHAVLLDDYSVETVNGVSEYLSRIGPPIDRVEWESSLIPRAEELMAEISHNGLVRHDGRHIPLTTPSGKYACALLDVVFQETKMVDYNIIIHPIEFSHEQEEMRIILQTAKGGLLPFTLLNVFFKNGTINKVYVTSPEGRTNRVGL
ncbi:hypothetical protein A3C26_01325 [Candidatus Daviesbacteria bacterium RIFCSPHIGHO2_02_FULL_39_12]|uniref:Uncharacterized protein n=2 Tax=Candidatus Daviesiibacteriota TaxID=1752718 RepID=A0A1F5JC24_9BACT|nr:MAG: hypothetical protein A3C26_01325 [Candidatus Daviesbacteria bacterium RIFCSPHIGHO2_02_FULL_39_12]OGE72003.1 MAG: hypothetical protein A3H40_00475 [Candidatus Daviesbacteria bacterium RIFCSPLOWO2_02_FULL_38_15]